MSEEVHLLLLLLSHSNICGSPSSQSTGSCTKLLLFSFLPPHEGRPCMAQYKVFDKIFYSICLLGAFSPEKSLDNISRQSKHRILNTCILSLQQQHSLCLLKEALVSFQLQKTKDIKEHLSKHLFLSFLVSLAQK